MAHQKSVEKINPRDTIVENEIHYPVIERPQRMPDEIQIIVWNLSSCMNETRHYKIGSIVLVT
ncbi:MAG: hypothetical protein AAB840_01130 [Patescibacteria group bacterium]